MEAIFIILADQPNNMSYRPPQVHGVPSLGLVWVIYRNTVLGSGPMEKIFIIHITSINRFAKSLQKKPQNVRQSLANFRTHKITQILKEKMRKHCLFESE